MKVYYHGRSLKHRLYVQPAINNPDAPSEWKENDGKAKQMEVLFENGVADVPENLGKYLIDKQLASKTKIHIPREVA